MGTPNYITLTINALAHSIHLALGIASQTRKTIHFHLMVGMPARNHNIFRRE